MGCQRLEQKQVQAERSRLEKEARFVAGDKGRTTVHFHINLEPRPADDAVFAIISNRARSVMYRGPFQSDISIDIDQRLTADEGYDGLEFRLLQPESAEICIWVNERGEPYWRAGAHITISILKVPILDPEGLPKRFDVAIH